MADTVVGTIDQRPILGSSVARWELVSGTRPYIGKFDMRPEDAKALFDSSSLGKKPVTLRIYMSPDDLVVTNLWVLNILPGDNPFIYRVVLADRRWFWSYSHVLRRYNWRRRTGVRRAVATDEVLSRVNPVIDAWTYARWSLHPSRMDSGMPTGKWEAKETVEDVLKEAGSAERAHWGQDFGQPIFRPAVSAFIKEMPIENLAVDDAGDAAVSRVLAALPEAEVYVNKTGAVVVYSRADGGDFALVKNLGPEMIGGGHADLVSNALLRPKEIEVLFSYEAEVRFNLIEESSSTVTGDERNMENVLPSPDYQILGTVNNQSGGTPLSGYDTKIFPIPQGQYIRVDDCLNSSLNSNFWGVIPQPLASPSNSNLVLTHTLVRQGFLPFCDLWSTLGLVGSTDADTDWISRIAALQGHYRKTFRVYSRWTDRILEYKPYRVATIDNASGQRAPAMAYGDYCLLNSTRSLWRDKLAGRTLEYAQNQSAYSDNIDSTARPSPASVEVVDSDQGVIHLEYLQDAARVYEMILPSMITEPTSGLTPHGNLTQRQKGSIAFNAVRDFTATLPQLSGDFKLSVILTAIPASPNNNNQLHKIVVRPSDVMDLLPTAALSGVQNAQGPKMQIRVGPGIETARVMWLDSKATETERLFGLPDDKTPPNLDGMIVNDDGTPGGGKGAASLQSIARAMAARIYASLADRMQGSVEGKLTPGAEPGGWASSVGHGISTTGVPSTSVTLPEKVEPFDLFSFLDSQSRAIILRLVKP